jgi:hypothetical protein
MGPGVNVTTLDDLVFETPYGGSGGSNALSRGLSSLAMGFTLPPLIWAPGFFSGAKWPRHGVEFKNEEKLYLCFLPEPPKASVHLHAYRGTYFILHKNSKAI